MPSPFLSVGTASPFGFVNSMSSARYLSSRLTITFSNFGVFFVVLTVYSSKWSRFPRGVIGTAVGLALGVAVGAVVGVALVVAVGVAVGVALVVGVAVGVAVGVVVGVALGVAVGVGVGVGVAPPTNSEGTHSWVLRFFTSSASEPN